MPFLPTLFTAAIAFAATNIDDIFVLMMFFAQTNQSFRRRHVVLGQYIGITTLIAISMIGFLGSFIIPQEYIGLLGFLPITLGIRKFRDRHTESAPILPTPTGQAAPAFLSVLFSAKTYSVASVTFANGGDNIGIYTPLFASLTLPELIITIGVFLLMVPLWCFAALRLTRQKHITNILAQYEYLIVPFVLIGLGVYILLENESFRLLGL